MRGSAPAMKASDVWDAMRFELVDIALDGGEEQILGKGLYFVCHMNNTYVPTDWSTIHGHIEMFLDGAWKNYIYNTLSLLKHIMFMSDGANMKYLNVVAPGTTYRLVGVRHY